MRLNSLIMLLIAVVFGAAAVFFANQWLARQSQQAATVTPAPAGLSATIVVAAADLPFGTTLKPENLREISWPKGSLPNGAFSKIADLTTSGQRRVVLSAVGPNEPILKWKISGPDARASLSSLVDEGMRAVGIRVNEVVGVGGFILPGDRVDILFTRTGNGDNSSTDILIQNARVLGIDQLVDEKTNQPIVAKVVTVEVNSVDAQKIALAQSIGALSLSLRSAGSLDKAPAQRIVAGELTSSPSVYETEQSARTAAEEALKMRFKGLEEALAALGDRIASSTSEELKQLFASLKLRVRAAIAAAGEDKELKTKLTELEIAIMKQPIEAAEDEAGLRAKLLQFEAKLREITQFSAIVDAGPKIVPDKENELISVGVVRGTERQIYQVPSDFYSE